MKKYIVTSVLALACAGGAFAQGTVNWGSTATQGNTFTAQTNSTTYSPLFGGGATGNGAVGATATTLGGFYYALLYTSMTGFGVAASAPTTVAALGTWTASNLTATNRSTAGQILPAGQASAKDVGWASGITNSIMLVGWSANLGTTWTAAYAALQNPNTITGPGYFGMSSIGYINPSTSTTIGVNAFASSSALQAYGQPINSLNTQLYLIPVAAIPEPGTMALAGLGGLAMLALRRKK